MWKRDSPHWLKSFGTPLIKAKNGKTIINSLTCLYNGLVLQDLQPTSKKAKVHFKAIKRCISSEITSCNVINHVSMSLGPYGVLNAARPCVRSMKLWPAWFERLALKLWKRKGECFKLVFGGNKCSLKMLKCKGPKPFLQGLKVLKEPCFQLKNTISVAQCLLFLAITRTKQVILTKKPELQSACPSSSESTIEWLGWR